MLIVWLATSGGAGISRAAYTQSTGSLPLSGATPGPLLRDVARSIDCTYQCTTPRDALLCREKRRRWNPLDHWKGERVRYNETGAVVAEKLGVATPAVEALGKVSGATSYRYLCLLHLHVGRMPHCPHRVPPILSAAQAHDR